MNCHDDVFQESDLKRNYFKFRQSMNRKRNMFGNMILLGFFLLNLMGLNFQAKSLVKENPCVYTSTLMNYSHSYFETSLTAFMSLDLTWNYVTGMRSWDPCYFSCLGAWNAILQMFKIS